MHISNACILRSLERSSLPVQGVARSATYLPEIAEREGWTLEETIKTLVRKSGYTVCSKDICARMHAFAWCDLSCHDLTLFLRPGVTQGSVTKDLLQSINLVRYQSSLCSMTHAEYAVWVRVYFVSAACLTRTVLPVCLIRQMRQRHRGAPSQHAPCVQSRRWSGEQRLRRPLLARVPHSSLQPPRQNNTHSGRRRRRRKRLLHHSPLLANTSPRRK